MEWPNNLATKLTNQIMAKIREHLLPDQPHYPHHYNRTFEEIHRILTNDTRTLDEFLADPFQDGA